MLYNVVCPSGSDVHRSDMTRPAQRSDDKLVFIHSTSVAASFYIRLAAEVEHAPAESSHIHMNQAACRSNVYFKYRVNIIITKKDRLTFKIFYLFFL